MDRYRITWLAASAALLAALCAVIPARAQNPPVTVVPTQGNPIVRVQLRAGTLAIRTWNRREIRIESSAPVQARHYEPDAVAPALRGGDIPIFATPVLTPDGPRILPPEEFFVPELAAQPHDGVAIFAGGPSSVTVTVPASTALVVAIVGRGTLSLQDYRGGAFVTRVRAGAIALRNVGGDAYVESVRGHVRVNGAAFNRLRARTALGDLVFENCNARQIEVTTIAGNILYDRGTFVPGLARFESEDGDIGLGIAGGSVQIGAHSSAGQIYTNFAGGADVRGDGSDEIVTMGTSGPLVTVNSQRGAVYLYDGTLASRKRLAPPWTSLGKLLRARISAERPYRV